MEEGTDFEDIESVLCVPGGHFHKNPSGVAIHIKRANLTPLAQYWMASEWCCYSITVNRAMFIYCMLRRMNVNIGQVIASEIKSCATTVNTKEPLGHPSLITHLCQQAGMDTSTPPFERPKKAIDEAYYRQYCGGEVAAQPVPQRRPRRRFPP